MVLSSLQAGLVINGAIASVEEKGATVDMGLANSDARGFVPAELLPPHQSLDTLQVGQVMLFKVVNGEGGQHRVIALSGVPETTNEG